MKIVRGILSKVPSLRCEYEEADNRLMLHTDDALRSGYKKVIIALADTEIFVKALYHYTKWIYINLQELRMICGKGETSRAIPLHEVAAKLETTVIDVFQALQALTGCDKTSKICSKNGALKAGEIGIVDNLVAFGKTPINIDIIITAKNILVKFID